MKYKLLMTIALLSVLVLGGCSNREDGCQVKGVTIKDNELCQLVSDISREQYELGKVIGKSCNDEIIQDIYKQSREFYIQKYSEDFREKCLLIITDGKEPQQSQWYQETDLQQFDKENMFPIRTWDLETEDIKGYGDNLNGTGIIWEYYILCDLK